MKEHQAGLSAADLRRKYGVSDATFYKWRSKYGGMEVSEAKRLRELASQSRRFGYRRLHILLKREGVEVNWKKLYRLYREERLTVRKRGGRKRALGTRAPMTIPQDPNQRWSLDFVSDTLVDGRRFRILCVLDDFSRECLATVVDNSISGNRVARELDAIAKRRGYSLLVVSDNGTELTANAMLKWQQDRSVVWHYIAPGKPPLGGASLACRTKDAERLYRKLRRKAQGRVPQRASLHQLSPCAGDHRRLEDRLQSEPTAHEPRRAHPERICNPVRNGPQREQG